MKLVKRHNAFIYNTKYVFLIHIKYKSNQKTF